MPKRASLKKIKEAPTNIKLDPNDVRIFQAHRVIIEQQEHTLNALRMAFVKSVEDTYHVDVANEAWELDLDKGELRRATEPTT
jgi:hypothetical protein